MIKAKNNRLAIPAVLALLLCCVASASPTYSFVKMAGEWAFYDDAEGLSSTVEAVNQIQAKTSAKKDLPASQNDALNLPAVSSMIAFTGGNSGDISSLLNNGSSGGSAKASRNGVPSAPSDTPSGNSSFLPDTDLNINGGFQNAGLSSGLVKRSENGTLVDTHAPNGNAWGYWKKRNGQDGATDGGTDDIAPPVVTVPVPGSIILAAIGAALVKLLHDRRIKT